MYRWHEASCSQPDVVVLSDKIPHCLSCRRSPSTTELATDTSVTNAVPRVPPDRPVGQMNLCWPPSVPYSGSAAASRAEGSRGESRETEMTSIISVALSYSPGLLQSQFRLICLSAVDSYDDPLHLTLEVYGLDDCPEYETVSYTWAGEDGDGSLCRPIFVGPFWDILFQTKNCWEMLRFARPWRGTRMIWVDAVCVNQRDVEERNSQVANMGHIYSSCSRVIIYLGPDIAVPLHGRHPRRHRLHELESGTVRPVFPRADGSAVQTYVPPHGLSDLLRRRYFSRIWVVQELVLSQRVVLRVGDVDFWADPTMASHFSSRMPEWSWEQTRAAWVQHIARGPSVVKSIKDLFILTSLSQATDPRDRIFGLLGVMPELSTWTAASTATNHSSSITRRGGFHADYSLSCQQVFIGLFAYCLINMRAPAILYHASCLGSRMPNYPSWAPNWMSRTTWTLMFKSPKISTQVVFQELMTILEPRRLGLTEESHFKLYTLKGPAKPYVSTKQAWHQGANIDASTGALNINLTKYIPISRPLGRVGKISAFFIFAMQTSTFTVYIFSEHELDKMITKSRGVQLFTLTLHDDSLMYLILQPASNDGKSFRLVSTCPFVFIKLPSLRSENEIPALRVMELKDFQYSLYEALEDLQEHLNHEIHEFGRDRVMTALFPGVKRYRHLLPIIVNLFAKDSPVKKEIPTSEFIVAYISCLDPRNRPRIEGGDVLITVSSHWSRIRYLYNDIHTYLPSYFRLRYRLVGDYHWDDLSIFAHEKWTSSEQQLVNIRIPIWLVRSRFEHGTAVGSRMWKIHAVMRDVLQASEFTGEDFLAMLERRPRDEDQIFSFKVDKQLGDISFSQVCDELQSSGQTFMVSIN